MTRCIPFTQPLPETAPDSAFARHYAYLVRADRRWLDEPATRCIHARKRSFTKAKLLY